MYNLKAKEAAAKEEEEVMRVNPHPQPSHSAAPHASARAVSMVQEAAARAPCKVQEAAVPQPTGRCRYCGAAFALVLPYLYAYIMYYKVFIICIIQFFVLWRYLCQGIAIFVCIYYVL